MEKDFRVKGFAPEDLLDKLAPTEARRRRSMELVALEQFAGGSLVPSVSQQVGQEAQSERGAPRSKQQPGRRHRIFSMR